MRDFCDAKAMAQALRDALRMNLSAKIGAAQSNGSEACPPSPAVGYDPLLNNTVSCSFCGKTQHEVETMIAGPPPLFICNECVGLCGDILANQEILSLLKADEEHGNLAYPAAFAHVRSKSTEQLAPYIEHGRKGAERFRLALQCIERTLAMRDDEVLPEGDVLTSPGFGFIRRKTRKELLAFQQQCERELKRYEDAQRHRGRCTWRARALKFISTGLLVMRVRSRRPHLKMRGGRDAGPSLSAVRPDRAELSHWRMPIPY